MINGAVVATVQDATYAAGRFWIGAGHMLAEPTPVDVRFDDLVVSQL